MATQMERYAVRLWAVLYFPINWSTEPGNIIALIVLTGAACTLMLATTNKVADRWLPVEFILLAAIPPLHLLLIGPDLGKSRLLYLPSVGFCLLLACAVDGLRGWQRVAVPAILLLCNIALLEQNLSNWRYVSAKVKVACTFASDYGQHSSRLTVEGLPATIRGVPAFSNGFPERLEIRQKYPSIEVHKSPATGNPDTDGPVLRWDDGTDELRCSSLCLPRERS